MVAHGPRPGVRLVVAPVFGAMAGLPKRGFAGLANPWTDPEAVPNRLVIEDAAWSSSRSPDLPGRAKPSASVVIRRYIGDPPVFAMAVCVLISRDEVTSEIVIAMTPIASPGNGEPNVKAMPGDGAVLVVR